MHDFNTFGDALIERKRQENRKIFDRVLKGKFEKISAGDFESALPPLESISIIPVQISEKEGHVRHSLNAVVYYRTHSGAEKHITWSVFEDGTISGFLPKDLSIAREDLAGEILNTVERIHFDFWRKTDLPILPKSDEDDREPIEPKGGKREDRPLQPERLEFLRGQQSILFGFVNERNGFRGYHGAVLPHGIILEHPRFGNAAYVVRLSEPIVDTDTDVFDKPSIARVDDATARKILEKVWAPIAKQAETRGELRDKFGAKRIVHTPDTWQRHLQAAIDELS